MRFFARSSSRGAEPVLHGALGLDDDRGQARRDLPFLHARAQADGRRRRAQAALVGAGVEELRVGLARQLVEALVEHLEREPVDQVAAVRADRVFRWSACACRSPTPRTASLPDRSRP